MLQIDLKQAADAMNVNAVIDFLTQRAGSNIDVKLISVLLKSFSNDRPGLPFINDSVFFIGNAYLQCVDEIVSQYTTKYIRFVDDYKIFGNSKADLERILPEIRKRITSIGFELNDSKNQIGDRRRVSPGRR
jgi:hypothetical protein